MEYQVRKATPDDLPRIEEIYAYARRFMELTGNPNQWGKTNPPHEWLVQDIKNGNLFVITEEETIHGVFYFWIGPDPTYGEIEDGAWRFDPPYGTIHRIASDGSGGILRTAVAFCSRMIDHIRIDTHHDNLIMQKAVVKLGFQRSGIIHLANGSPRIAYELHM
ncbi:MAG: N-acetyltransferase [Oscillospiraceae bacterium]|nr:N-acetyltransferase [Oscillospiraceae bacterium]